MGYESQSQGLTHYSEDGNPFTLSDTLDVVGYNDQRQIIAAIDPYHSRPLELSIFRDSTGEIFPLGDQLPIYVRYQLSSILPAVLSNQASAQNSPPLAANPQVDPTIHILSSALNAGHLDAEQSPSPEMFMWQRNQNNQWSCSEIGLPPGTNLLHWSSEWSSPFHFSAVSTADPTILNKNGLIATLGSPAASGSPLTSAGKNHALLLVPVEVKKVWSDQLPGVEANFLPYVIPNKPSSGLGTGRADKPYILMGAAQSSNFDGKAHIKAQVTAVGGSPELRDKILWRLAKKNGATYTPANGTSTYDAKGEVVTITLDSPGSETHAADHYHLVGGYDQDGDGQLSSTEASVVPKYKWKGKDNDYEFKVISTSKYNSAKQQLNTTSSRWGGLFPQAQECLLAFLNESVPDGAASESTTVDRLEYGLDHPVGILFNANQSSKAWGPPLNNTRIPRAGPGASITAVFNANSLMSRDVANSTTINNWLSDKLNTKSQEVRNYFTLHPNEDFADFNWDFDTKDVQGKEQGLNFSSDADLFLAIGKGTTAMNVQVSVNRGLHIDEIRITGDVLDLFDFDYDATVLGLSPQELQSAAEVQSGYNTLGTGGRVYKSRVEIRNYTVQEFIYQFL